jgi:hypothetical protein
MFREPVYHARRHDDILKSVDARSYFDARITHTERITQVTVLPAGIIYRCVSLLLMHLPHEIPAFTPGMIVNHRQGMLAFRGCCQSVDPFPAGGCDEFVGELGFLGLVSLIKLTFDHGLRLGALAGLLIEHLARCLPGGIRVGADGGLRGGCRSGGEKIG